MTTTSTSTAAAPPAPRQNEQGRRPLLAAAIAVALGTAPQVYAATEPGETLEEVVVTANRREQNVLDVPYNISAVSGPTLSNAGVTNLSDISRLLPGVTIPDLGPRANSSNSLIIIRGLNVNDPVNSAYLPWGSVPTVSTYVDDVPLFVNLRLADIQRIEVLRGPQGTLYGSGAVGGTVRVIHNPPTTERTEFEISARAEQTAHAANGSYAIDTIFNLPLGDRLAWRVSASYDEQSGFINANRAVVYN